MTNYSGEDIYCDLIIPRNIDIEIIKETNNILAFKHTKPYWPTHIVVVPKKHIPSYLELPVDSEIARELLSVIQDIAKTIRDNKNKCRIITNLGDYQDSKHLHFHISEGEPLSHKL